MKIAIVHEMLIKLWGAERVLQELIGMYPEADVYTLMYDEAKVGSVFPKDRIRCCTPAQMLYSLTKKPRLSLPLMPLSIKSINLSGYDLVISSSSGFAHGVKVQNGPLEPPSWRGIPPLGGRGIYDKINPQPHSSAAPLKRSLHICYCHSPARYLWDWTNEIQAELGIQQEKRGGLVSSVKRMILWPLVRLLFSWLRRVDLRASERPDLYIANSIEVQKRIQRYYHRDSVVLWPPVDTLRFSQMNNKGFVKNSERKYFVLTSALTPFKQVDRAVRVMTKLGINLRIIGDGAQKEALQEIAGRNIEFLGRISDEEVAGIYQGARGFLMPQKEDAGIAPIEAMAAGLPVLWLAEGWLLETNIDGVTGRFFHEETDESFEQGFLGFHREIGEGKYDNPEPMVEQARKFNTEHFRQGFQEIARR